MRLPVLKQSIMVSLGPGTQLTLSKQSGIKLRYAANSKLTKPAVMQRYATNPEPANAAVRRKYATNPELVKATLRSRHAMNPKLAMAASRSRYLAKWASLQTRFKS